MRPKDLTRLISTEHWGNRREAMLTPPPRFTPEVPSEGSRPTTTDAIPGFTGTVTGIAPLGHGRVIFAYEQFLPILACGTTAYHFTLPGCKLKKFTFTLTADANQWQQVQFLPRHRRDPVSGSSRLTFRRTWANDTPKGSLLFSARPADPSVQVGSARPNPKGPCYVCVSVRPKVPLVRRTGTPARRAIFLLDTSRSETSDRQGVYLKLLKAILAGDDQLEQFNVLTFNVAAAWIDAQKWLPNTPQGRKTALDRLDGVRLEGATDLSCALEKLVSPAFKIPGDSPVEIFLLSDGKINWGETSPAVVERFFKRVPYPVRFQCYRLGLGDENKELFAALTRRGGGVWRCGSERELSRLALAHRREGLMVNEVRFQGGPHASDVLVAGRQATVFFGGELLVVGKLDGPGKTDLVVKGTFQGKPVTQTFPIEVTGLGELAERAWAEVAVAQILALGDAELEPMATAYCQQFGIASRVAELQIPGKPEEVPVIDLEDQMQVHAPQGLQTRLTNAWAEQAEPEGKAWIGRLIRRSLGRKAASVLPFLSLLSDADCRFPESALTPALGEGLEKATTAEILAEVDRLFRKKEIGSAVGVLSRLVELHPDSSATVRLVACRLLEMRQPAQAARLFRCIAERHPVQVQAHRDLARSLAGAGRYALAALLYEIIEAGPWEGKEVEAIRTIAREDYARLLARVKADLSLSPSVRAWLKKRLPPEKSMLPDLRVVLTWNDGSDLDLRVIEPDGTRVTAARRASTSGGQLSADQTDGFGPERYHLSRAAPGEYSIEVHLAGKRSGDTTYAQIAVQVGDKTEYHGVLFSQKGQTVTVCRVKVR